MAESNGQLVHNSTFALKGNRPTIAERIREWTPVLFTTAAYCTFLVVLVPILMLFALSLGLAGNWFIQFIVCLTLLSGIALASVYFVRYASRHMLGGRKKKLEELEQKLSSGQSVDVIRDVDTLITENLKMGRCSVAEYYSQQLLSISEKANEAASSIVPAMLKSTSCWVSTPEYHRSIRYHAVWMFESCGTLSLGPDFLQYDSPRISFRANLKDVKDVFLEKHPCWMKPITMHFITITFEDNCGSHTFHMSPFFMQTDTVWDIDDLCKQWYAMITTSLEKTWHMDNEATTDSKGETCHPLPDKSASATTDE